MKVNNTKKVTTYYESEREFIILQDEYNKFWAIEDKYIDDNGRLTQEINGITGLRSDTVAEAIEKAHQRIVYQGLIAQGYSMEEAFEKMFGDEM